MKAARLDRDVTTERTFVLAGEIGEIGDEAYECCCDFARSQWIIGAGALSGVIAGSFNRQATDYPRIEIDQQGEVLVVGAIARANLGTLVPGHRSDRQREEPPWQLA